MKWAYLTHDGFVFGRGRAVSAVVADSARSGYIRQQAAAIYETTAYFRQFSDKEEFVPALGRRRLLTAMPMLMSDMHLPTCRN